MAHHQLLGLLLLLQCYNLKKYFNSESLKDAMNSLYNYGVKGKLYDLIFELNKSTQIQVKTSVWGRPNVWMLDPV